MELGSIDELVDALRRSITRGDCRLIGIDGTLGCGKTKTAKDLAEKLPAIHLEVDGFLERDGRSYADQVRYSDLKAEVKASSRPRRVLCAH